MMRDRQKAWELLCQYTLTEALRKHALAVEAVMRWMAKRHSEDEELWGMAGLLHDFDYEAYPKEHPFKGAEILREHGYSEDLIRAILGHAQHTQVSRETLLAKVLFACDELTGFIIACALVNPQRIFGVRVESVRKKLKDKAFARNVNREDILKGAAELGVDLDQQIALVIEPLKEAATSLGLSPIGP